MSTEYYRLKTPFTSVRTRPVGVHVALGLWVNHAKTGEITLRQDEVKDVLLALVRASPSVRQYAKAGGAVGLEFYEEDIETDKTLISQYGDLTCLAEIDPSGRLTEEA